MTKSELRHLATLVKKAENNQKRDKTRKNYLLSKVRKVAFWATYA